MKATLPRRILLAGAVGLGLLSAGCGGDNGGVACTASVDPGVVVTVVDATTLRPAADGATATLTEGNYTETMQPGVTNGTIPLIDFRGAFERAGTYTMRVTKPGYTPFEQTGIVVTRNVCHVNMVSLRAELVSLP